MRWNWPILTAIKNFYNKNGLLLTIPYVAIIAIGAKFVLGNAIILIMIAFGSDVTFPGPLTRSIMEFFSGLF
jgi:hypothetical protein